MMDAPGLFSNMLRAAAEEDAVGINSVNYWSYMYGLRGNNSRVLFNPYANNSQASIKGVNISGVSITQL